MPISNGKRACIRQRQLRANRRPLGEWSPLRRPSTISPVKSRSRQPDEKRPLLTGAADKAALEGPIIGNLPGRFRTSVAPELPVYAGPVSS